LEASSGRVRRNRLDRGGPPRQKFAKFDYWDGERL
jgi:hypothetical protein